MAFRTWAKLLSATLGVGVLAGASQLGLAYGLGIVRLTRVLDVTTRDQWTAQLAWVAWFPMTAAVVGALASTGFLRRWAPEVRGGTGTELALAFAAAIGAAVVVPLTMQPARTAQIAGVNPVVVIAICSGLGALVGVFAAWAALAQAVARWSLVTLGAAIWALALVSVSPSLAPGDPLPAVRLGVFDAGFLSPAVTQRTALATMPALALLAGAALGWAARRRELPTLTIALAGLPGPALLTISYLIAGPGAGADRYQVVPYWAAMTATGAGVLGSVLAAVLRRGAEPADDGDGDGDDRETPTENRPPLPKRTEHAESAVAAAAPAAPTATDPPLRASDTAVFEAPGGRRPSAADAFTGRTGEFSTSRPEPPQGVALGEYAQPEPAPFDAFGGAGQAPKPYVPEPATRPLPPEAVQPPATRPLAPEAVQPPAGRPLPPEAAQAPAAESPRSVAGRLGRSLRPTARGRVSGTPATKPTAVGRANGTPTPEATGRGRAKAPERTTRGRASGPLTPEPTAVSPPLPQPEPVTPPLPLTPAPRPAETPPQATPKDQASGGGRGRNKFGLRRRKDEDYVDWVSELGR
ncbi:hypothetical protein AB0J80_12965 [Actinoplanes sp. NPDC049548]|uniref:hypothetical protein n=1 Tax=Actinoplanes sp. NPDC049548 TaxID=3155152 RepID=UPI003446D240